MFRKFETCVVEQPSGCWLWTGLRNRTGYGVFGSVGGRLAHRIAYERAKGPISDGLFVCHSCDNPLCVNPAHLWLGTNSENIQDSVDKGRHFQASKTHCSRGHEYTPKNTYVRNGRRACRACNCIRSAAYKARKELAA